MKLTGSQIFWTLSTVEIIMAVWLRVSPAIETAKQDAWMSMIIAGAIGLAITYLVTHVSLLHPGETLTQFSRKLLGGWIGRIVILPYFVAWFLLSGDVLRSFADFIHLTILDRTPIWILMVMILALAVYLTGISGITGIGRFCELAGPVTFITLILTFLLNAMNTKLLHILPIVGDSSWQEVFKASLPPASFFGESFMLLVLLAFISSKKKIIVKALSSIVFTSIMVMLATVMVLLVFGPYVGMELRFSYFMLVRSINILNFIQNVDVLVIFIWIFGVFAKISLYLFITSYEMAQWLHVKNWKKLMWFCAPAIFIIALLIPNEASIMMLQKLWERIVIPVCAIAIPLFLWMMTVMRRKITKH
ncbi:spore germination protein (amino acid permease) [Paenibacillus rhizosphaerae]|uniref:Spore germination protein (Amino acid permease) n=1 Tax=Paenibacillus rhizosphaerae TaxID=297318 RepID=A0A839TH60_9BACL|nr:endospore germination permease [Paenibacillus rhizosphaerae]MBB3126031.1 spore germination protein (amino acid permease) [Paenibacillus rhizosphaerae]